MTSSGGSKTSMILVTPFHMGTLTSQLLLMPQTWAGELNLKTSLPDATGRKMSLDNISTCFIGLKTFAKKKENIHIRLRIDNNTTAVSTINYMGTNHSDDCNAIGKQIWEWCIAKKIWLSASYIPGKHNVTADVEPLRKQNGSEWMINEKILQQCLESLSSGPDIDLFASRMNYQLEKYVSFKPDPGAIAIDAFSLLANLKFYAFPPFSVIPMVLRKIQADKAIGICVFPNWPTQAWFPKATAMLLQDLIELKIYFHYQAIRGSYIHYTRNFLSLFASYQEETRKYRTVFTYARYYNGVLENGHSQTI